jgi:hypothetical protein
MKYNEITYARHIMTKIELLLVRACKTSDPQRRVRSVYQRYYGRYQKEVMDNALVGILATICDSNLNIPLLRVLSAMSPQARGNYDHDMSYTVFCVNFLISKIQNSEVSNFNGYVGPARFRKSPGLATLAK